MSVSVISSPLSIGWARNRNEYRLQCNDVVSSGRIATFTFSFSALPPAGCHVVLSLDGRELVYSVVESSPLGAYEVSSAAMLRDKMASNFYVCELFRTACISNRISLVGKSVGAHIVELYPTNSDGMRDDSLMPVGLGQGDSGADEVRLPNYAVAYRSEVVVNDYNSLKTYMSDFVFVRPDNEGIATIRLDTLAGLIPQPDIPSSSNAPWQLLTNAVLKYRISYGEVWGSGEPLVQSMVTESGYHFALCGEAADRFARVGLPDWNGGNNALLDNDENVFWVLGEDNGISSVAREGQRYYVYGMFFDSSKNMGSTLGVSLKVQDENGVEKVSRSYTALNGSVYRIDLGPSSLSVSLGRSFSVTIASMSSSWTRLFTVLPDMYDQHHLLLQSKYGVLLPFVVGGVRREVVMSADAVFVDRRRYLHQSESYEIFSAVSPMLSRSDARRMAACLPQQYHYILCGTSWMRITIEPSTFVVSDSEEGMVRVEFQYRFVENQTDNVTNGSLARTDMAYSVSDILGQVVAYDNNIDPNSNSLR